MTELIRITHVRPLKDHWPRLWFSDGAVKDVNLDRLLARGRVFAPIRDDRTTFEAVEVNSESGTIQWPGEVDLDPDVLYGRAEPSSGTSIARRTVTEPTAA